MSATRTFPSGTGYQLVALVRDQEVLHYRQFGQYQGEWVMLAYDAKDEKYVVYKGWYGSCSGCDSYEGTFDSSNEITEAKALEFADDYKPFAEIPRSAMISLCLSGKVDQVFPANIRDGDSSDFNYEEAIQEISIYAKRKEKLPISLSEIRAVRNTELKQELVKEYGYANYVRDIGAQVIDKAGDNELLKVEEVVFVSVKDSSTERRYLLRVPPTCKTVKESIAWTFGMTPEMYQPIVET